MTSQNCLMFNTGNSIFKHPGEERLMRFVALQFLSFIRGLLKCLLGLSVFCELFCRSFCYKANSSLVWKCWSLIRIRCTIAFVKGETGLVRAGTGLPGCLKERGI